MFEYTIDELIDLYNKEDIETRGSLNDFIKKINNPTDPKKAKGDTKKDTKVDPKSTVSSSVNGSLGLKKYNKIRSSFGYKPLSVDQYRKELDKEITAEEKEGVIDFLEELTPGSKYSGEISDEVTNIYNKRINLAPKTEFGTIDFDNEEVTSKLYKDVISDFQNKNTVIQDEILPRITKDVEEKTKIYVNKLKLEMGLNNPENVNQDSIDELKSKVNDFYNKNINTELAKDREFQAVNTAFNNKIEEIQGPSYKRFIKGKDSPSILKLQDFTAVSGYKPLATLGLVIENSYNSIRGIGNSIEDAGVKGYLGYQAEKEKDLIKKQELIDSYADENIEGVWITDDQNLKNSWKFIPKTYNREGDSTLWRTQVAGSDYSEGTFADFKKAFGNVNDDDTYIGKEYKDIGKRLSEIQDKTLVLSQWNEDEFDKIMKGEDIVSNAIGLAAEQLPQMALSFVTLGASSGAQIGSDIYAQGIDIEAKKRFNLPEGETPSVAQLADVLKDEKFMSSLETKAVTGGFVAGQLERFGAGKTLKAFTLSGAKSILRGGYKNFLKKVANGSVANTQNGLTESITEVLQEIIQSGASGANVDGQQLFKAGGTGFISSLTMGVGGNVVNQSAQELKTISKKISGKLNPNSSEAFLDSKLRSLNISFENEEISEKAYKESVEAVKSVKNANASIPKNFSKPSKEKALDLLIQKQELVSEIEGKDKSITKVERDMISEIDLELESLSVLEKGISNREKLLEKALESGVVEKLEIKSFDSKQELEDYLVSKGESKESSTRAATQMGRIVQNPETGNQEILINKEVSIEDGKITTADHEFLHAVLYQTVKNNRQAQINLGQALFSELTNQLGEDVKNTEFGDRLNNYLEQAGKDEDQKANAWEEALTLFAEGLGDGTFKENTSFIQKIKDFLQKIFGKEISKDIRFDTGADVVNFIKEYNKSFESGKWGENIKKAAKEGIKGSLVGEKTKKSTTDIDSKASASSDSLSSLKQQRDELDIFDFDDPNEFDSALANIERKIKIAEKKEKEAKTKPAVEKPKSSVNEKQIGDRFKEMVPQGTTNAEYQANIAPKVIRDIEDKRTLFPLVKKIAAGYGIVADNVYGKSFDDFYDAVIGVQMKKNIMNFKPESNDDLGGYIIGSQAGVRNRVKEALAKFKKEEAKASEDIGQARDLAAEETTASTKDTRKKYTSISNSNVVPNFTVTAIKDKLTGIISKLKSKITDKAGDNAASTPLIKEIKKNVGKVVGDKEAIPKLIRQRMGAFTKDRDTYKSFLIKNKKAIIENMTTTWLSTAVPIAVEKSVGGSYTGNFETVNIAGIESKYEIFNPKYVPYSEWKDAKIDREGGARRGITSGNELTRRVPVSKISDQEFVDALIFKGDNKKTQTKFESLSKALAEELSFEIISKELKNPNSEISLAFEANQQALGVMIQDNIAQEFSRQAERGLVKFSMSNNVGSRVTDFLSVEGVKSVNAKKLAKAAGFTKTAYENFIQRVGVNTINRLKTITDKEIALQEINLNYLENVEEYEEAYSGIKFSISKQEAYKNTLKKKRPNLDKNQIESSVQSVFNFAKNPNIQDKKRSKLEKLAFHYMANGFVILPEDGYKVIEAEKIATAKKIDPFSFKNPNELIEKYAGQVKKTRTNPDNVKELTNKKELPNGVVTYDVQNSKKGQLAVREVIDTNWGEKSNPWCLVARSKTLEESGFYDKLEQAEEYAKSARAKGYSVDVRETEYGSYSVYSIKTVPDAQQLDQAFKLWKDYNRKGNGFKISFKDGKLLSFRDGNKKQWWDRMDKPSNNLVYEVKEKGFSVDGQKTEVTYSVDAENGSRTIQTSIVGDKKSGNYIIEENTTDIYIVGSVAKQIIREFKNGKIINRKSSTTAIEGGFIDTYVPMVFQLNSEDSIETKYENQKVEPVLRNLTQEYLEIPYSRGYSSVTEFLKSRPKGRTLIKRGDLEFYYNDSVRVFKDATVFSETNPENDSYKTLTIDGIDVLVGPKEIDLGKYVKAKESGAVDTGIKFSKSISSKLKSSIFRVFYEDFAGKAKSSSADIKADRDQRRQAYDLFDKEFIRLLGLANESDRVGDILLEALKTFKDQYITEDQYQNIIDNARNQYIPIFERKDFETKSFERLLFEIKGDIDKLILPQVRSVGVEESMFTLRDRLKGLQKDSKEAFDILKSYIENESRSIRTFSYLGISTNNKFNLRLQEIGIKLEDYGIIVEEEYQKYRVYYISDEGVKTYITGYKTIEETKNKLNKDSFRKIINEEASSARDYTYSLLEYYTNKIKNAKDSDKKAIKDKAFAHFQVLSLDQTGVLRKVSKAGLIVLDKNGNPINNKKQKKLKRKTRTILEHSVTINDITKEIKNTIYSNNQDLKPLKDLLEQAYVNVVTNKQDDMLTKAGLKQKGGARRVFQTNFKKSIDRLNEQGRVYGYGVVYGESIDEQQQAINNTTKPSYTQNPKGISVWDFDDTLARTKSNVLYTMPDGTKGKLDAAEFAARSESLADIGAEFDFSEFSEVMKGEKGPMFDKAIARNKKFGNENVYILTARPPDSKFAIHKFLKGIGLDIKLDNIVGLADGNPQAKANWMIGKVAEGYNDFYFADDHLGNVKAVKEVLDTFDVKGKVQQAKIKFSASLDKNFNDIIQRNKGVLSEKEYSKVAASRLGARKGRFKVWMPSSLDDFKGLTMYAFSGKGKQGEADQKFFQDALITPYFRGVKAIYQKKQALKDDFKKLNKMYKPVLKKLGKLIPNLEYTHDQAIRVYLWNKAGYEIPGLDIKDKNRLVDFISKDKELLQYTQMLQRIAKRKKWTKPSAHWDAETILSDLNNITEKVGRKEYLAEFIENVDVVFSEKNLNKVEALYGRSHREALEDIMYRMKNGTNRPSGNNKNVNRFNNWINNSIGAIMFFNRRSAVLQTLSTANFINWSDNNMLKAGLAFANQPQFWKDFTMIFNSAKLKQRRSGLRSDVNEAEIASAVKGSKNKALAALSYLLKIGFTPTQMVDSFAIASGGASFYRNRLNTYISKVNPDGEKIYTQKQAEQKAFDDFSVIAEETQQSGDPALISSDQASALGRLILAFQNTPIQLNRSIKKAALDIKNRRRTPGLTMIQSDFSNLSKIIYYGAIQNLIFSALQNALFALIPGFEDEDDELTEEEQLEKYGKVVSTKQGRIINGISDTILKGGFGVPGAFISTIKNVYLEYKRQEEKDFMADNAYVILQAANLAPSVGSKLRKIYSGMQTEKFEKDVIEARGWDVTIDGKFSLSPKYRVLGAYVEGSTNFPLERMTSEVESLTEALDARNSAWQRVALALGWRTWDVGAKNEEHELIKAEGKAKRKKEGIEKAKVSRKNINDMKKAYEKSLKQVSYKEARIKTLADIFKGEKLSSLTKDVEDIILKEYEKQDSIKDIMFEKGYKLEKNKFVKIK